MALQHGVAVHDHGAELPAAELAPAEADAAMPVKHRAGIHRLEKDDQPQDQRPEQQQAQKHQTYVERPLRPAPDRGRRHRKDRGTRPQGGRSCRDGHEGSLAILGNEILNAEHLHEHQPYKKQQNNYQRGGGRGKDPAIT